MKSCCANCGATAGDDIKLRNCAACHLVSYCSVKCQREHRPKHKRACKKRAAEIRDEHLFKQPEGSYLGDCPICFLPMSLDVDIYSNLMTCCGKIYVQAVIMSIFMWGINMALTKRAHFVERMHLTIRKTEGSG